MYKTAKQSLELYWKSRLGGAVAGQVIFSTDELKKRVGIPTKAEWAARYNSPMEGPLPPGVPEYDPLLGAGQFNSKLMPCCVQLTQVMCQYRE